VQERTSQLAAARDQAQAANQAKSVFLGNVSHELRNPLAGILAISSLMKEDAAGEQREYVEQIERSGDHLLTLINDVLDMAKIEAGKTQLEAVAFDVVAFVEEVVHTLRARAVIKGLTLSCVYAAELERYVRADAQKLRQVLTNIVGNAIKFTSSGQVACRISSRPDVSDRAMLRVEVEDTGVGISLEDQTRIFEPFVQARNLKAERGTGLGLAISREFITLMGGGISVSSVPGKGSRFTVEVPVQKASPEELPDIASPWAGWCVLEPGQPEFRILLVEDDPQNAMVMNEMLRRAGFEVRVAPNGEAGVREFEAWNPQFIWMDLRMPEMTGMEAVRVIRGLNGGQSVRIAAITASAFASDREAVLAAGMDDFLIKPYHNRDVFACMARHLGVRYQQAKPHQITKSSKDASGARG
jgi:CheY-like chemotaxis protein/two-component sensor histidine kinase